MTGIEFIVAQSRFYPAPRTSSIIPPGGGKLDKYQTAEIIRRRSTGETLSALGHEFGVSAQAINYIMKKARKDQEEIFA